jgi:ATP synthase protein I
LASLSLIWNARRVSGTLAIDPEAKKMWATAGTAGALGLELLLALAVGWFGGQWIDRKLGTAPWFQWVGLAVGVGAAINALVRVTRVYKKSLKDDVSSQQDPKP